LLACRVPGLQKSGVVIARIFACVRLLLMTITRRNFQKLWLAASAMPALGYANKASQLAPSLLYGCASGDVSDNGVMLWTRADQPSQLWVEISKDPDFDMEVKRIDGGTAGVDTDFNLKVWIDGLAPETEWHYRLTAESLRREGLFSDPLIGKFMTAERADSRRSIRFCWSGDTAGQGWGVPPFNDTSSANSGMKSYAAMLSHDPQFFVHSGDQIYADGPIQESVTLDDGSIWRNLVTRAKSKVAETTQDFRENYYYNYIDANMRSFHSQVPVYYQWDDHEVINNWYPGEILTDDRYTEKNVSVLAARSKRAMFECNPLRPNTADPLRVYRVVNRGPLLDLFFLDLRSYRGANSLNRQTESSADTDFLGAAQIDWLKQSLLASTATWKIICSDMPLGIIVTKWGTEIAENGANGDDGAPLGRELELAGLLKFIKDAQIKNLQFITADVHYCASIRYNPEKAGFKDFNPFWEHISGPLHAGTFPPGKLDGTFGPEQVFCGVPDDLKANRPPSEDYQFFGKIDIDAQTEAMTVSHYNSANTLLWSKVFPPG